MKKVNLFAVTKQAQPDGNDLEAINRLSLSPLTLEDVFLFRLAACDDQPDRDAERFPEQTLRDLAKLFPGKPVLRDHNWSAGTQIARVYAANVDQGERSSQLILSCYMLRTEATAEIIRSIEAGILRECSVGVAVAERKCSICGQTYGLCSHIKGEQYSGQTCIAELHGAEDAYEVSFVAVPAQPEAGTVKATVPDPPEENVEGLQLRLRLLMLSADPTIHPLLN